MNLTLNEGIDLMNEINDYAEQNTPSCDIVVCSPFIHLVTLNAIANPKLIGIGAQDCSQHASGAFTGEVSAAMIASTGARYVIIGHSERRQYHNETASQLKSKVEQALENGLKVIFCIGETLDVRQAGRENEVVGQQLEDALLGLPAEATQNITLAYEPVWAIGTGQTATAQQAQDMHAHIRSLLARHYGENVAQAVPILYGGSCKPGNAAELFSQPDIDGGLIGGAALKAEDFIGIIKAAE